MVLQLAACKTLPIFRSSTTITSSSNMQPRKGNLTSLETIATGQGLLGRHGLPLLPLLHVRLLPWHLRRRLVFFCLHFILLRYPEAFPLHRDPEAHLPSEEQGRQQRQTSGNARKNLMCLIRCLPCLWPITTDRES